MVGRVIVDLSTDHVKVINRRDHRLQQYDKAAGGFNEALYTVALRRTGTLVERGERAL